jgi:hypothetical protein
MRQYALGLLIVSVGILAKADGAAGAKVFFVEPKDKAVVGTHVKVKMGVEGMKICPANTETKDNLCGHHHLIIDGAPIAAGQPIPNDPTHLHFGKLQTESEIELKPGHHTLTLQFADFAHRSFGEKMSSTISVDVK